jgi:hypothetical protein
MSLTFFVTLCVLGCDFLIYFLYQWALGERRRTLMRKAVSRQRAEALANRQPRPMVAAERSAARPVLMMGVKRRPRPDSPRIPNRDSEELAYRRVAASFAQSKSRA